MFSDDNTDSLEFHLESLDKAKARSTQTNWQKVQTFQIDCKALLKSFARVFF
jgi:hypothetical protein